MADFTDNKSFRNKSYPVETLEATNLLRRCEPILTPGKLKSRYLKDIDVSSFSNDELKDQIILGMNKFELLSKLPIQKTQYIERIPFDRQAYKAFVYFKLGNGPILSIEEILIESSNSETIYTLPPDWIEVGFAHKRQINLIPILSIFGASGLKDGQASNAGLIFLQAVNNFRWLPAFFTVTYTCGISKKEGQLPIVVNEVVGMNAAIAILSQLATKNRFTSTSISQDGVSQSASGPGTQLYKQRIEDITIERDKLLARLKSIFHQKYFLSNI